jgi:hypothetical protein
MPNGTCPVVMEGKPCGRPLKAKGLCVGHWQRQHKGLPLEEPWGTRVGKGGGRPPTSPLSRIHQNLPRGLSPSGDGGIGSTSCVRRARCLYCLT